MRMLKLFLVAGLVFFGVAESMAAPYVMCTCWNHGTGTDWFAPKSLNMVCVAEMDGFDMEWEPECRVFYPVDARQ